MSRQALGRGLSALVREEVVVQPGDSLREIDIDLIKPNSEQPRTRFAETALEELAQSIRENGIIQPVVLRPSGSGYELIAGERRWRAAQRAELRKIPAVIREVTDEKKLELALIENIQRQELNPIEEAKAFKRLIEIFGLTQEKLAERIGKDRVLIANHLRLLKLPEDIQVLVEERKISAGHARAILSIVEIGEQRRLAREVIDRSLSVREAERIAKRINGLSGKSTSKGANKEPDANIKAAEVKLQRRLGTKVNILPHAKNPGGRIEIEYYGNTDLHRIYELLMQGEESSST
ncbi:MAG TPA: ParB/RepB/Spo0J family partition protein [Pyrinomonadaceae bacterium]|jgi:ParB family chromosome partitioning protein|nr:ParB/RepB/Spo0J family partition protein [Pyrinomonadaceae bacterium]